jgi:hypothetical protein
MGYTTEFSGQISINPPLNEQEIEYLCDFCATRHMERGKGIYYVDASHGHGDNSDVPDYNNNGKLPGLWCHWVSTDDGTALEWDEGEKFYNAEEWMRFVIDHFLRPGHLAPMEFLQGHTLNGSILAQGEDINDRWRLIVENNEVSRIDLD